MAVDSYQCDLLAVVAPLLRVYKTSDTERAKTPYNHENYGASRTTMGTFMYTRSYGRNTSGPANLEYAMHLPVLCHYCSRLHPAAWPDGKPTTHLPNNTNQPPNDESYSLRAPWLSWSTMWSPSCMTVSDAEIA